MEFCNLNFQSSVTYLLQQGYTSYTLHGFIIWEPFKHTGLCGPSYQTTICFLTLLHQCCFFNCYCRCLSFDYSIILVSFHGHKPYHKQKMQRQTKYSGCMQYASMFSVIMLLELLVKKLYCKCISLHWEPPSYPTTWFNELQFSIMVLTATTITKRIFDIG